MAAYEHMVGLKRTSFHTEITNVISRSALDVYTDSLKTVVNEFHRGWRGFVLPLTSAHRLSPLLLQPAWKFFFPYRQKKTRKTKEEECDYGSRVRRCRSGAEASSMRWTYITEQTLRAITVKKSKPGTLSISWPLRGNFEQILGICLSHWCDV